MSQKEQTLDLNAEIEEIEIVYDVSLAVANEPSYGINFEIPDSIAVPGECDYAVITSIDRARTRRAYPKLSRVEPTPEGEDLDIL
jgi:hypothetical protein